MPSAARRNGADLQERKIESNLHIGSFVGFAPAESPNVALLVTVNEAKVKPDFGGTTAAPFAAQIFEEILPLLGVAKTDGSAGGRARDHAG